MMTYTAFGFGPDSVPPGLRSATAWARAGRRVKGDARPVGEVRIWIEPRHRWQTVRLYDVGQTAVRRRTRAVDPVDGIRRAIALFIIRIATPTRG